ncbi:ABC transporter substrate-binding protein [Clostridium sporogenes]|uniref:Nitrate ABC transporter substrate-binding protein n=1 Tax=Clostridium sporogenes TaxID=1509 RepID=A0ABX4K1N9_CLOSG|nr:ABC transporter substrate-binding protein [Clostridium sporogenes]MCW6107659.1 ABC transporter substrate-binding protein [Clostridium sporogenes]NFF64652.1 ABC transporter substrate-binding protein [Clostridium sporogenes]NFH48417.1 ABC transporter substrate-binding protein [Clostridium sporogenes]PHG99015.1 nitrate ABC transporter substrate-binding protein [Clostridium sporogenes]UBI13575.1 ABC transporter substrate-binding protein [Clostridium sporogenes]
MKNKKITVISLLALLVFSLTLFAGCNNKDDNKKNLTKVRLNEVVRSVFYAPMYVAINEGIFEEEGIEIDLSTGQGADKTMQQVLSKSADIGFCGPEQVIYIYNQKREDYPVLFAQLTQSDGSFLVGRKKEENFKWESLKGKKIIGGRPGGMPEMALEYVLKSHGINPKSDVDLITNIAFTATAGAFKSGTGDYAALFEPTASMLEKENAGHIVASIGESAGNIPYTCYFSTKSYMEKNPETIQKFTNAIYKAQKWIDKHTEEEIAKAIISFFPGAKEDILVDVIKNYKKINSFANTPTLKEENLNKLMDIIQSYDKELIPTRPEFNKIVNTKFSKEAEKNIK